MFEVGFSEILMILALALLVLGPEKLPGLAEKVGRWTGRARSMARQLRSQLEQEVQMEQMAKSRPMQAPPPSEPPPSTTPEPPHAEAPHANETYTGPGLDLDQMVSDLNSAPADSTKPTEPKPPGSNE